MELTKDQYKEIISSIDEENARCVDCGKENPIKVSVGMLISSFTENSIIAGIIGELAMFIFLFIDDFSMTDFISQYPKIQSALYAFAAQPRFAFFSQGFIRLSDLVFFASAIIVLLTWNYLSLEKRRWNRG